MTKIKLFSYKNLSGLMVAFGLGMLLLAFLVATPASHTEAAPAAAYAVTWYTADNGGGSSSGSNYTVAGTIGQMDSASNLDGAGYGLQSGFWAAFVDRLYEIFLPAVIK